MNLIQHFIDGKVYAGSSNKKGKIFFKSSILFLLFAVWVDKKKKTELFLVIGTDKPTLSLIHI